MVLLGMIANTDTFKKTFSLLLKCPPCRTSLGSSRIFLYPLAFTRKYADCYKRRSTPVSSNLRTHLTEPVGFVLSRRTDHLFELYSLSNP